jgi:hypothetical protein
VGMKSCELWDGGGIMALLLAWLLGSGGDMEAIVGMDFWVREIL